MRRQAPSSLPWRRPRHELLLLLLVAVASLSVVQRVEGEDPTRMCLTAALTHGHLHNDSCFPAAGRAVAGGHSYANVAPGVSALAIPAANLVGLPPPERWQTTDNLRLWFVRVTSVGLGLLACAFLLGRVAEGLAPGWGGATLVTFALGTIASAVAPSIFDHAPAAALGFGAFLLAWSRRPLWAGLAAGLALPVEYQASLIVLVLAVYVLASGGKALARFATGAVPGALLIGAYDWAAFGSPLRTSYAASPTQPHGGLVGIELPSLHGTHLVLAGDRGLLVVSPVLLAAAAGLWLLRRRAPLETAVCAVISLSFVLLDCGYALPYGGDSPGPRFVVTALPFAAIGLAPAFARLPIVTSALAVTSVIASTAIGLTWPNGVNSATGYDGTVWRSLAAFAHEGSSAAIATWIEPSVFGRLGAGRLGSAAIVFAAAGTALALALAAGLRQQRSASGATT
jgi:hypothetical protein